MKLVKFFVTVILFACVLALILYAKPVNQKTQITPNFNNLSNSNSYSPKPIPAFFYPITSYSSRLMLRRFGQLISTPDQKTVPCGEAFVGFHTGDDLETFPSETNVDVPVYAVAAGTINSAEYIGGYGGLLILDAQIQGSPVTIYYGHVNLSSVSRQRGNLVSPGEKLAILGKACSPETAGERKHLHFAIHKGSSVDVRGYVQTNEDLGSWLNPEETLKSLAAVDPGLTK